MDRTTRPSYYALLEVGGTATPEEIRAAYRLHGGWSDGAGGARVLSLLVLLTSTGCRTRLLDLDAAVDGFADAALPDLGEIDAQPPDAGQDAFVPCTALHVDVAPGASAPHLAALDPTGSFTIEAWFFAVPTGNGDDVVGLGNPSNAEWGLELVHGETLWFHVQDNGGGPEQQTGVAMIDVPMGRWSHLAGVFDTASMKASIFIDGHLLASQKLLETKVYRMPGDLRLGAPGYTAEVRISSTARYTTDFVPAHAFSPDAQTVALYHLDEGMGQTAHDAAHNADAALVGSARFDSPPVCR